MTTLAEVLVRRWQVAGQEGNHFFFRRAGLCKPNFGNAAGSERIGRAFAHARADHDIAPGQDPENAGMAMGFARAGVIATGTLGVGMLRLVRPHLAALDSLVFNLKDQETRTPTEVGGNRVSIVRWHCNSHWLFPFRFLIQLFAPHTDGSYDQCMGHVQSLACDDFPQGFPQPQKAELLGHREPVLVMRHQQPGLDEVLFHRGGDWQ
jgi:hypothetical protein